MKICSCCKIEKLESEFNKDKSRKTGLSLFCKICSRKKTQLAYRKNRKYYISKTVERKKEFIKQIRKIKSNTPCSDCGLKYPYYVMDFDHKPTYKKSFCIGHHRFYSKGTIEKEIDKCDLVCSNCHRIRTHKRRNGHVTQMEE